MYVIQLTARDGVHVDSVAVGVEDAAAGTEGLARLRARIAWHSVSTNHLTGSPVQTDGMYVTPQQ